MTDDQELEFFTIKSKFFREIPHPKLILKAINQVEKMAVISTVWKPPVFDKQMNLDKFLQQHSDKIYALKSMISRAEKPVDLYTALNELYVWHFALLERLESYLPAGQPLPDAEIKQSDPVDSYKILQFIGASGLSENQIKPYICTEIETGTPAAFSILTRACLQAGKINSNVRSRESS